MTTERVTFQEYAGAYLSQRKFAEEKGEPNCHAPEWPVRFGRFVYGNAGEYHMEFPYSVYFSPEVGDYYRTDYDLSDY
jgi:hypothetical protein